jgi:hypothetical protein
MFAQFKNVVESFAQNNPASPTGGSSATRSNSVNAASSPANRQRTGSQERPTPARTSSLDSRPKLSLEDRLKATISVGGPASTSLPNIVSIDPRGQTPIFDPTKISLPESPPPSPTNAGFDACLPRVSSGYAEPSLPAERPTEVSTTNTDVVTNSVQGIESNRDTTARSHPDEPLGISASSSDDSQSNVKLLQEKLKLIEKKFAGKQVILKQDLALTLV